MYIKLDASSRNAGQNTGINFLDITFFKLYFQEFMDTTG